MSNEKMIKANGVDLCAETFGDPSHPATLLIMGAYASMVWWPDGLCRRLAEAGRFVIRYDNRDTGRSITYPPGHPGYGMDDLADDAVGILDAYGIERAHLVAAAALDWSDQAAVLDYMVGGWRLLSGSAHAFDEAAIRAIAGRELSRANNLLSMFNHALLKGGERWYGKIGEIRAPTLVIHGTDDPALPYPHGVALHREIPHSHLLTLEGTGHEIHAQDWDKIVAAIIPYRELVQ
jgi:pimeloyl-ACP methyl ester carboxylesterase